MEGRHSPDVEAGFPEPTPDGDLDTQSGQEEYRRSRGCHQKHSARNHRTKDSDADRHKHDQRLLGDQLRAGEREFTPVAEHVFENASGKQNGQHAPGNPLYPARRLADEYGTYEQQGNTTIQMTNRSTAFIQASLPSRSVIWKSQFALSSAGIVKR